MDNPVAVYSFHGIDLSKKGGELKGDCPFCGKTAFYVRTEKGTRNGKKIEPGMFGCMACGESGNAYTFMRKLWERSLERTTTNDYKELAEKRGLRPLMFKKCKFAKSITTKFWIMPAFNKSKGLTNLYVYVDGIWKSTIGCSQQLLGLDELKDDLPSYLVEGHWDRVAWKQALADMEIKANVLAVPGCEQFKQDWVRHFVGSECTIMFDNDEPGNRGKDRTVEMMEEADDKPSKLSVVTWNGKHLKDVNDMLVAWGAEKLYKSVVKATEQVEINGDGRRQFKPTKCESFDELVGEFKSRFGDDNITHNWEKAMASCLAVYVGVRTGGEPLWLYLMGPASSGKSTICEVLSANRTRSYSLSKMSQNVLDSGWKAEGKKDVSIIPKLNGKVLVIKDFTTILSLPISVRESIYGVLRDCYDGVYRSKTGGEEDFREYWSRFGCVAGVTHDIMIENRSSLGERFLRIDIGEQKIVDAMNLSRNLAAMDYMDSEMEGEGKDSLDELRAKTSGLLDYIGDRRISENRPPSAYRDRIAALAELCSFVRSRVQRGAKGNLLIRPTREYGIRLSKQLYKHAVCTETVTQWKWEKVYETTSKIAVDTSAGFVLDIMRELNESGIRGLDVAELSMRCTLSEYDVMSVLRDMKDLGLVSIKNTRPKTWRPTPGVRKLWSITGLGKVQ